MNKLSFSEGGQPVYLDDLKLLQDNCFELVGKMILPFVGNEEVWVPEYYKIALHLNSDDKTYGVTLPDGYIVVDGEIYAYQGVTELKTVFAYPYPTLYVCLSERAEDVRQFENGQKKPCRTVGSAYLSFDNTGVERSYDILDVIRTKNLPLLISKVVEEANGKTWVHPTVSFRNGYSGVVKYREMSDCYRVYIDIKSNDTTVFSFSPDLFWTESLPIEYFCVSDVVPIITENGVQSCGLAYFEGMVRTSIDLTAPEAPDTPSQLPVKAVFEIPK